MWIGTLTHTHTLTYFNTYVYALVFVVWYIFLQLSDFCVAHFGISLSLGAVVVFVCDLFALLTHDVATPPLLSQPSIFPGGQQSTQHSERAYVSVCGCVCVHSHSNKLRMLCDMRELPCFLLPTQRFTALFFGRAWERAGSNGTMIQSFRKRSSSGKWQS